MTIPDAAICQLPDRSAPCPFWQRCDEEQQRLHSGFRLSAGQLVQAIDEILWGESCHRFLHFTDALGPKGDAAEPIGGRVPRLRFQEPR